MTEIVVSSGQTVSGVTLSDSDTMTVLSGGVAILTTLNNSAVAPRLDDYGTTISSIVNSGGLEEVFPGGASFYTMLNAGGESVDPRAVSSNATVNSGGREDIFSGASVFTTVNSGGSENVHQGTARNTLVNSGGLETVSSGGATSNTTVNNGVEAVYSGGVSVLTTVNSGGREAVISGGLANLTTVNSGGLEVVSGGGVTSTTQVNNGGALRVEATASVLSGLTIEDAGAADIFGSMPAGQQMMFIGGPGGHLALYNPPAFGATIGGFSIGDQIDLATIAFGPSSTVSFTEAANNTSGTLTVTNGDQQRR